MGSHVSSCMDAGSAHVCCMSAAPAVDSSPTPRAFDNMPLPTLLGNQATVNEKEEKLQTHAPAMSPLAPSLVVEPPSAWHSETPLADAFGTSLPLGLQEVPTLGLFNEFLAEEQKRRDNEEHRKCQKTQSQDVCDAQSECRMSGQIQHVSSASVSEDADVVATESKRERKAQKKRMEQEYATKFVQPFLERHGFVDAHTPRRNMFRTSYPLHVAVREGSLHTIRMLITAGADLEKTDSAGRTPKRLAEQKNWGGSKDAVLAVLTLKKKRRKL